MAKEKKKRGCFGCLSWIVIIVVGFLVLGFIASMFSEDESDRDDNDRNEEIDEEQESEDDEVEEQVIVEENEEQEEVEIVDEEEVEEDVIEEELEEVAEDEPTADYTHEIIDGIDVYTEEITMYSHQSTLNQFSDRMLRIIDNDRDDFNNGVVFRLISEIDSVNEGVPIHVASVWYSQSTIERLPRDAYWDIRTALYDNADAVIIHAYMAHVVDNEQKPNDNTPDFARWSIGAEYEELTD